MFSGVTFNINHRKMPFVAIKIKNSDNEISMEHGDCDSHN